MRHWSALRRAAPFAVIFCLLATSTFAQAAATGSEVSAKTWLDRQKEIEDYIRTAEIVNIQDIPVGVTKPKKCILKPGGPVEAIAWKYLPPGRKGGYWESYKSDIAAYELDKLLGLGMVPPTVEKRVKGELGAAVMWASPTQSFKELGGPPKAPPAHLARWSKQLIQAKMFDNLIYNMDPNQGNWLVDPAWNLILIDHTRSFTTDKKMAHEDMRRIDPDLWARMEALTEESLTAAIGEWIGKREIRALLERRDRMRDIIEKLVKDTPGGKAAVFVR
jgi:hypothetical protein